MGITTEDLLKRLDEQSVNLGRLALQKDALERENTQLKQALIAAQVAVKTETPKKKKVKES